MSRSEFDFIQNIKSKYSLNKVGDDCAVLPKDDKTDLLVTADMLVEDIDFRLDWTTPEFLGHKTLVVSLSDIAAMGGTPKWAMLSIGLPERLWKTDFVDRFYEGWFRVAKRAGVELVGGDISSTTNKFVVDCTAGGEVSKGKAILRSGAVPGDAIVVTFRVGAAAGGLQLLINGCRLGNNLESWEDYLIGAQLEPHHQVGSGIYLQTHGLANSMIDISDGLSSDLLHICNASHVGARLISEQIPLNINLDNLFSTFDERLELGLHGGEDYALLFTLPKDKVSQLSENMIGHDDLGLFTVIGEITKDVGKIELIRDGNPEIIQPKGYQHFLKLEPLDFLAPV